MTWTEEHDLLFLREMVVSNPFQFKGGSRERGKAMDAIADVLNAMKKPYFKVDQRALRDHLNKLLKEYRRKKAYEEGASGIDVEVTEIDTLLEEVLELQKESELLLQAAAESKSKADENEQKAAQSIRRKSLETWSQSKKRESESSDIDEIASPKRTRNNGNETVNFLREKSLAENEFRNKELELKQQELDLMKQKEENANQRFEQLIHQSQQQNQALMFFMAKMAEKL